jgi:hypothetical protein
MTTFVRVASAWNPQALEHAVAEQSHDAVQTACGERIPIYATRFRITSVMPEQLCLRCEALLGLAMRYAAGLAVG